MKPELHPLQFDPIFKERIWGGEKLHTVLNKSIPNGAIGESWELSAVGEDVSVISNGSFKGMLLSDIINEFPEELLGTEVYKKFGKQFPLLFKFIDAREDLSIQVHPNDAIAKARHNSFGKTEMWYIMQADDKARIIVGFKKPSGADEYLENLKNKTLPNILNEVHVKKGDVVFLETGTVHAVGAGILLAEIQQTSDITYRIYDWDRVDADGKSRDLHVDLALDAINYDVVKSERNYKKIANLSNPVAACPYFTTDFIPLNGTADLFKDGSTFTVFMCIEGSFSMTVNGRTYFFKRGDTILVPAAIKLIAISGNASLLEIYIS